MAPITPVISAASSSSSSIFTRLSHSPASASIPTQILRLLKRQSNSNIDPYVFEADYGSRDDGPAPGTVVGIVLGSVAGFLLILWLIYTCANFGMPGRDGSDYTEDVVVRNNHRKSHGSSHSRRVSETVEVRRGHSPAPIRVVREPSRTPERVERVIVEERRETRRERSRGGSDEVVVIEEHSPPPRKKSSRREKERDSGYRTVDPQSYGGVVGGRKERRSSGR